MSAEVVAIPFFDPTRADPIAKLQQNATFCNKPPPFAPRALISGPILLMQKELHDEQPMKIMEKPRFRAGNWPHCAWTTSCGLWSDLFPIDPADLSRKSGGVEPTGSNCYRIQPQHWAEIYSVKSPILAI
jgi:hypothetical protein